MDLKRFDSVTLANKGVDMELKDLRTGQPSGAFITLLGMDSDEFKRIRSERARAAIDRASANGSRQPTDEEMDAMAVDGLAALTIGWWFKGDDGMRVDWLMEGKEQVLFSHSEAARIYRAYPAIREQVNVFIAERRNFLTP